MAEDINITIEEVSSDINITMQCAAPTEWGMLSGDISNQEDLIDLIPTNTSDLTNDSDFVSDADYVHTDNNYTDIDKTNLNNQSGTNTGDITVTDSTEIDFTLTGQDLTASIKSGSIDETKLDTSVNASLGLADSALQSFTETDPIYTADKPFIALKSELPTATSDLTNDSGFITSADVPTALSELADDSTHRLVTDAEKSTWNGKQDALGFTPENVANKNANNGYCGLDSGGKVPIANLPATLLKYQGVWNASTNTPTLVNPDLTKIGNVYNVGTAGTQFGITFSLGDWAIYNANGVIEKSDNSDDVVSVNGRTGAVTGLAELSGGNTFAGNQTFDTNTLFVDSVNHRVGVGAISPGYRLDIKGAGTNNEVLARFYGDTNTIGSFVIKSKTTGIPGMAIGTYGNNERLALLTANVERINIDGDGNVGIGMTGTIPRQLTLNHATQPTWGMYVNNVEGVTFKSNTNKDFLLDTNGTFRVAVSGSTGYVGIGTPNPGFKLDVQGAEGVDTIKANLTGSPNGMGMSSNGLTLTRGDTSNMGMTIKTSVSSGTFGADGGYIAFSPNNTESIRILKNGNVGIGTTTPSAMLDVYKSGTDAINVGASSNFSGYRITSGSRQWAFRASANSMSFTDITAGPLDRLNINTTGDFNFNSGDVFFNNTSGNVGIGTTSPSQKLDVKGIIKATTVVSNGAEAHPTGIGPYVETYVYNGNTGRVFAYDGSAYYDLAIGDWNSGNPNLMLKVGGNIGINRGDPTYKLDVAGNLRTDNGANFATVSGNVGIGTSNPNSKLEVFGSAVNSGNSDIFTINTNNVNTGYYGSLAFRQSSTNVGARITSGNGTSYSGYLAFETSNQVSPGLITTEKMRIDKNGNVGIGTTNPLQKLDVSGNITTFGKSPATFFPNGAFVAYNSTGDGTYGSGMSVLAKETSFGGFTIGYETTAPNKWLLGISSGVGDRTGLSFFEDSQSAKPRLTIATGGNVGIGTTSPASKLQVVGLNEYADNAAAIAAGLTAGAFYRTGDLLKVVH